MMTPKEFRSIPEWGLIEDRLIEMLAEETDHCLTAAAEGKIVAQYHSGRASALRDILRLPNELLKDKDEPEKILKEESIGHSIVGHARNRNIF